MSPAAYFILPNTEIAPDTLIHLGQIIPSPREPHRPICPAQTLPPITPTTQFNYTYSTTSSKTTATGLFAHFLAQLGSPVSGGISLTRHTSTTQHWSFESLETHIFEPDATYISQSIQNPAVKSVLQKSRLSVVYIITGLKIARGASYSHHSQHLTRTSSEISVDASIVTGVPLSAGPEIDIQAAKSKIEGCARCDDFVWAVRVRKIRLGFWDRRVVVRDVGGGRLYGIGDEGGDDDYFGGESSEEEDEEEREIREAEVEGWDLGSMYTPRGFREMRVVDEEGEGCVVFW